MPQLLSNESATGSVVQWGGLAALAAVIIAAIAVRAVQLA